MASRAPPPTAEGRALLARAFAAQQAGRLAEAEAAYAEYLARHPGDPTALNNAGALALLAGNPRLAVARYEQVAKLLPDNAPARCNLGQALTALGRPMDAVFHLERAVQLDPGYAAAFGHLGFAFDRAGARAQAIHAYERALELDPKLADAAANLGNVHNRLGDTGASRVAFAKALAANPANLTAKTGMAYSQALDGDPAGARGVLEAHAAQSPALPVFWQTLAAVRHWCNDLPAAEQAYRRASALDPADFDSRSGIASTLLGRGDFTEGWRAFEERPDGCFGPVRQFADLPTWDGGPLDGSLLVHCEQGLGDVVQFARFLPQASAQVGRIILVVDGYWLPLAPLLASLGAQIDVVTDAKSAAIRQPPPVARASILSLPWLLDVAVKDLPGRMPYLAAPAATRAAWREKLAGAARPRVGLAWAACARGAEGFLHRQKSIPLALLTPLLATPNVTFVSLQVDAAGHLGELGPLAHRIVDAAAGIRDFGDTAAIIGELDLVISIDTAVAHVAGASGVPTWLLDRHNCCWRWRLGTRRSLWYPSVRPFRQRRFADWSHPLAAVKTALAKWLASGAKAEDA